MIFKKSELFFNEAKKIIPGGVNSPVRACKSVGGKPIFIERANGAKIFDVDGNEYIDYVGSWGPMILGHNDEDVVSAIKKAIEKGTSFGAPTLLETELASLIISAIPSIEMIRMVNSGTEATMSAIRLARGYTKRDKIIKFDGCYHGHADMLLSSAGSGLATFKIEKTPGVPNSVIENTLSIPYNDTEIFNKTIEKNGKDIACVIIEPVAGNMGFVKPEKGFLENLRKKTEEYGALLIFDEVMTGFRVAFGGAQSVFNIMPDITCLGKIIGGGMPVGAYGGKKEIMQNIAPEGDVYQAGTLSGNPIAMSAGIAVIEKLKEKNIYEELERKTEKLINGLKKVADKNSVKICADSFGSMFGMFFNENKVTNFETAKKSDLDFFAKYQQGMLKKGIYLAPSQFEAGFVSVSHTDEDIEKTIDIADKVFEKK